MDKKNTLINNSISKVIFRIDFSTILKISGNNKDAADKFGELISTKFPNAKVVPRSTINVDININSNQPPYFTHDGDLVWIFQNENSKKEITLTANNLVLDYKEGGYFNFNDFLEDISLIINALKYYGKFSIKFLGLRYINQIKYSEINNNLNKYINKDLLNNEVIDNLKIENLIQVFNKLNFIEDEYLLTFQYGLFNPGFPRPDFDKNFILDYDCVINNINSLQDIEDNLIKMHDLIKNKFNYSITDDYVDFMNKEVNHD